MTTENKVENYQYTKDPRGLTKFVIGMFWVYIAIGAVALISDVMQLELLSSSFTQAEAEANDARQQVISRLYMVVFLVTGISFFKWTYRANLNSRGFGTKGMKFTPGWTVGYYFIPFLNLYKPYQALKEIWEVAKKAADWSNQDISALLSWWWAMWIIGGILDRVSSKIIMDANSASTLKTATHVSIWSDIISIVTALLLMKIIVEISSMHQSLVRQQNI